MFNKLILYALTLVVFFTNATVFAADRYVRAGGGNYNVAGTWEITSGGGEVCAVPTASDNVYLNATSGQLTINVSSACRSINFTGYTNTLTHATAVTLSIGDATAGAGNIALKFVGGMTYTLGNSATSAISFVSTSATIQTIDWGGKTTGNVTFNATSNGSWQYVNAHNFSNTATLTLTKGSLDTNGQTLSGAKFSSTNANVRTLTFGTSILNLSGIADAYFDCSTVTNLTVTTNSASVIINRNISSNAPLFAAGAKTWGLNITWNGGGQATMSGGVGSIYNNIMVNGAPIQSNAEDRFVLNQNVTITGVLTLNGFSSSRRLRFNSGGTSSTLTVPNANAVTGQYFDILNIGLTILTDLSAITGGSGNIDGNSGIIFTPNITCYWQTTTSGTKQWNDSVNWFLATNGGGGPCRVPLPQDDVRFDVNSIGSAGTIINCNIDMKRLGSNIDFTGVLNNPNWNFEQTEYCHGSLTLDPNMTMSVSSNVFFNMAGRGTGQFFTLKTCGVLIPHTLFAIEIGATTTVTLLDDFNGNVLNTTEFNTMGLVNFNNKNVTAGKFIQQSGTITMGSGFFTITGVGTIWSCAGTVTANSSTIIINNTSASAKTFAGSSKTYNNVTFSGDNITVTGNNTFIGNFRVQNAGLVNGLILTSGTTQTVTTFTTNGFAGNLAILKSSIAASFATLTKASGLVSVDYMSIKDSRATTSGTAVWYAGANSTNVSGNTAWIFTTVAIRYWVGGGFSNNWDAVGPTNWSETSGGSGNASVPTNNDNVFFDINSGSGNSVIAFNTTIRSIECTGYTGTLTHNAGIKLSIGNAVAWGANIGLKFVPNMTYTLGDAISSEIEFISTTTTVQSVDFASKTTGNVYYNGVAGSWKLTGVHNTNTVATISLVNGTLNTNGQTATWGLFNTNNANTRVLTLGASVITLTGIGNVWDMSDTTNLTFNANTSMLIFNNTTTSAKTFIGGGKNFNNVIFSGDNITITGSNTFYELRVQNAGLVNGLILTAGTIQTVTSFTTNGFASNLAILKSNLGGTSATITKVNGSVSVNYMSIQDITAATTGTTLWYAGANSLNVSGNGGGVPWLFINQPSRYWVGGGSSTNWNAIGPTNWSTTSGVIENAPVPASADNVIFDSNSGSGNSIINANITIRSLNTTSYTGTLTHNASVILSIGDENPGDENIALKFGSSMTYKLLDSVASSFSFISTSATIQTIDWGGKTTGNVTFNATSNGYWKYLSTHNLSAATIIDFVKGTLDLNSQTVNCGLFLSLNVNARTLYLGNSIINLIGIAENYFAFDSTNLTLLPNTSTINLYRNSGANTYCHLAGSAGFYWDLNLNYFGGGWGVLGECRNSTIKNISYSGAANSNNVEDSFRIKERAIIGGSLTLNGFSASRRMKMTVDFSKIVNVNNASIFGQYVDFYDVNFSDLKDLSGLLGGSGDARSNSNITFTSPITCYWKTTTGGVKQWNDVSNWYLGTNGTGGQARIPLPQDDVIFDASSINTIGTIVNVNIDVLRVGKNIDWTGVLNNPDWHLEPVANTHMSGIVFGSSVSNFGSLTLDPNMTMSSAKPNASFNMLGSGTSQSFTLKTCGVFIPQEGFNVYLLSSNTLTLLDDFNGNSLNTTLFRVSSNFNFHGGEIVGTVDFNGKNLTTGRFQQESPGTIIMGSGLFKMTGVGTVWSSAGTITSNSSTIEISDGSALAKTFAGGGKTYNNLIISGSANATYTFSGNNTFNNFTDSKTISHTLLFTAGSNTTFINTGNVSVSGSSGNLVTLASTTSAIFTWTKAGGIINCDYLLLSKSTATGGAVFNDGLNTVDGGGNTGWSFLSIHPFTWKGTFSNKWTDLNNWQGGAVPTTLDIAYFTGLFNNPCTINATSNCDIKGINITVAYSSIVTQLNTMTLGSEGFEINGGTFFGATQNIINAGFFKQTGGNYTNTSGLHETTAMGSGLYTWLVNGGTHNHNSGTVKISGTLAAIVNNTSASQFNHLEINTTGVVSGASFVDGNLTRSLGLVLDADISIKGDYLGSGVGGSSAGIGTIRFIGSTADQNFIYPYVPSIQINKSSFALIIPADIQVSGNWTHTAGIINWNNKKVTFDNAISAGILITNGSFYKVEFAKNPLDDVTLSGICLISNDLTITSLANLNNTIVTPVISNIELSGNYILNSSTWGGTSKIIFKKGVNPSNTIVGLGKQGVSAEVNMTDGILELWDNFDIWNTGHDLVIRSGTFDLRGYNLTVNDTLTIFGTMTLTGGLPQIISVNGTTSLSSNANFTLSATSSTIVYTDSAVTAIVTNLSNNFYNLTFGASKTHEFATGAPNLTTINGRLSSNGTAGTRSILRSVGNDSVDWKLTLNGTSTLADKVNVKRSDASGGLGVLAVGSLNGGNNTNWVGLIALPYVTSVTSSSSNGTYSTGVIPISVIFSEIVNVTGVPMVTLETGATDSVAIYASGTGSNTLVFNYTIQSGDASSDLDCISNSALVLNGGTIMNAGNTQNAILDLFTPGATNSLGSNKALVINTTVVAAPTVTGVSSSTVNGSYKVGDIIAIQVTFSALVNVTGTPTLTLETGTTDRAVNYSSGSGSTILVFNYTVQSGDTSLDLDYTAITSLALSGGTIKNAGATDASLTLASPSLSNSLGANKDIKIDTTIPTVSSVSASTADGNYNAGDAILITVVFSEAVAVTGAPTITLETGDTDRAATYVSGSGTTTLVFSYTVQSGDMAADLEYTATTALALASGTITDAASNAATLTLATPGAANSLGANKAIIIDTTIPVVLSVSSSTSDGIYKVGAVITITITFSKVVNVAGVPTLTLETGTTDRSASYASGSNSTVLVFNYTLQSGDNSSDLDYVGISSLSLASGSINDEFLNAATLTLAVPGSDNSLSGSKALVIDTIAPTFASQILDAGFTFIDITFSEPVYTASGASGGLASADFSLIFAKNGGTATGVTISSVTTTSGNATTGGETTFRLNFSVSGVIAGVETFSIAPVSNSIFDMAGNAAPTSTSTGTLLIVDEVGPTITNVTSSTADGNYKADDVISIQVVFSESVTVTGTPVLIIETGSTDQSVNYASGSGSSTLTFTYVVQSGDTSADLEVQSTTTLTLNGGTILDIASNVATLTLPTLGATGSLGLNKDLVVDTTAPIILSAVLSPSNDFVTITFSEAVCTTAGTGAIVPSDFGIDFSANGGSATGVSITSILTSTDSALVGGETTIKIFIAVSGTPSGQETVTVKALANSIFDLVGNTLAARDISGTLTKEGGINTGTSDGGGGCQYSAKASRENGVEWLLLLLVMFLPKITKKRK